MRLPQPRPIVTSARALAIFWLLVLCLLGITALAPTRHNAPDAPAQPDGPRSLKGIAVKAAPLATVDLVRQALSNCRPDERKSSMSDLLHLLLLWGPDARVGSADNRRLVDCVLEPATSQQSLGSHLARLYSTRYGARFDTAAILVLPSGNVDREAHVGQALSILAEAGTPLARVARTTTETVTLRGVLNDSIANFSAHAELEWVTVALALYLPPSKSWTNRYSQTFTFDDIARVLLHRPLRESQPCAGTHALYTLAVLWQVDRQQRILDDAVRASIERYFVKAAAQLTGVQMDDGSWGSKWAMENDRDADALQSTRDRIWITGHHLDWMALVPSEFRPIDDRIIRAISFVGNHVATSPHSDILSHPCQNFHGVRGAARLCGVERERVYGDLESLGKTAVGPP